MINFERVLSWYSGKGQRDMDSFAIPTLVTAIEQGYWPKGTSRRVRAMLSKQAKAIRWAQDHESDLDQIKSHDGKLCGWSLAHAMEFGHFSAAPACLQTARDLREFAVATQISLLEVVADWADAFSPVADAVELLDRARPAPVYEFAEISPTVAGNVGRAIGVYFSTIRMPEIRWTWIEIEIKGKLCRIQHGEILWPSGTRHGASRFSGGSQCEACGHGIRDRCNWVPLVANASHPQHGDGPVSLWVGRDCARKLFGCVVTGDAVYDGSPSVYVTGGQK